MAGVWSFLTILVEAVVAVAVVEVEVEVEVMIQSVMNVVNLVILLVNAACALAQEDWEVGGVEVPVLDDVGAQVMDEGMHPQVHSYVFII